jgi:hypothetical protein
MGFELMSPDDTVLTPDFLHLVAAHVLDGDL